MRVAIAGAKHDIALIRRTWQRSHDEHAPKGFFRVVQNELTRCDRLRHGPNHDGVQDARGDPF